MGYDGKYGAVTTEHGDIPADEPVIIFRARDKHACKVLAAYYDLCALKGSPTRHLNLIDEAYSRFAAWQNANPDKVRTPDSERSKAWLEDGQRD